MIPYEHLVEAIGHIRAAINELNEAEREIPEGVPASITSPDRIHEIVCTLEENIDFVSGDLGEIMYYNKHHDDNGNQ